MERGLSLKVKKLDKMPQKRKDAMLFPFLIAKIGTDLQNVIYFTKLR